MCVLEKQLVWERRRADKFQMGGGWVESGDLRESRRGQGRLKYLAGGGGCRI